MRIAILTGASSGLGREMATRVKDSFPEVEEIWLVARRADRLAELQAQLKTPARALCADLTTEDGLRALADALAETTPDVRLLINNAGCGYLGAFATANPAEQETMIQLNVLALTSVTRMTIPYMGKGARILNISSIASFAPTANMAVYCSTKAYVASFSRALDMELRDRDIRATAVCPGPMSTEFLTVGRIQGNSPAFAKLPYCKANEVARRGLEACAKGRPVYTPGAFYKLYRVLARVLPTRFVMRFTKT